MADAEQEQEKKSRSPLVATVLAASIIGFVSGGLGFAVFSFLPGMTKSTSGEEIKVVDDTPAFVPFGEVVVNLGDARMSRYLRLSITLQVRVSDSEQATADVESRRAILRNWLLGYLSNLQLEDIRGAAGQNRIRREVQNQFNEILSPEGIDVVQDVLFEEFNVQ